MGLLNKLKQVADKKYYGNRTFPIVKINRPSKKFVAQKKERLKRDLNYLGEVFS